MSDLVSAARTNDLETLRHIVSVNNEHVSPNEATIEMQDACAAAASLANHPAAVALLIDSGCWISLHVIRVTLEGRSKDVFDVLNAKGWGVNLNLGHMGDALVEVTTILFTKIGRSAMIQHLRRRSQLCVGLATGSNDLCMVQFVLSRGADPNANRPYRAVEQGAAISSNPVLEALLNAGEETKGRSVLSKAVYGGRTDVVAFLLDREVAIDEVPNNDNLPSNAWELRVKNELCTAAWRRRTDVVKSLLDWDADAGVKECLGRSALKLAEAERNKACIHLLKEHIGSSGDM